MIGTARQKSKILAPFRYIISINALIKKTGIAEFQDEIVILSCVFNLIMSFHLFLKICGFHLPEELKFWENMSCLGKK